MNLRIRPMGAGDREWARKLIAERWGAPLVAVHNTIYHPHEQQGFLAVDPSEEMVGLVTYRIDGDACEIVTIDSLRPNQGIGSRLLDAVAEEALRAGCARLWLVTTNDNLNALRFYQKRGFTLVALAPNAVARARRLKPEIPLLGDGGIPLRDELTLERGLGAAPGRGSEGA